jgi:CheY-like chemotaxis protein
MLFEMTTVIVLLGAVVGGLAAAVFHIVSRGNDRTLAPLTPMPAAPEELAAPRPEGYAVQRLRVLVVDPNPLVGRTVTRLLDAHDVTMATSGEAALSALAVDDELDAILYALGMPGMPGVAFAAALAERHPALRPHLAFLIDEASTPATQRLLALSSARWVTKPISYVQLMTCVSEIAALRALPAVVAPAVTAPVWIVRGEIASS